MKYNGWNVEIVKKKYRNGQVALMMIDADNGEPITTCTSCLVDNDFPDDLTVVKNYSESEGLLDWLVAAGVVQDTNARIKSGFVSMPVVKVLI